MKTMRFSRIVALAAGLALVCGCMDHLEGNGGKEVKFKALSKVSYITKTSYSGDRNASTTLERIDWENGDKIRIVSDVAATSSSEHFADYSLSAPTSTSGSKFSYATASPYGADHGLLWGEGINKLENGIVRCIAICRILPDESALL